VSLNKNSRRPGWSDCSQPGHRIERRGVGVPSCHEWRQWWQRPRVTDGREARRKPTGKGRRGWKPL